MEPWTSPPETLQARILRRVDCLLLVVLLRKKEEEEEEKKEVEVEREKSERKKVKKNLLPFYLGERARSRSAAGAPARERAIDENEAPLQKLLGRFSILKRPATRAILLSHRQMHLEKEWKQKQGLSIEPRDSGQFFF